MALRMHSMMAVCVLMLVVCTATADDQSAAASLRFVAMGDWGSVNAYQKETAEAIASTAKSTNATFLLALGDNFYDNGVKSDTDPQWESTYKKPFNQSSLQIPWYSILGNHDHHWNPQAQVDYYVHKRDHRWTMPAMWYTKTWAIAPNVSLQIVFIDTVVLAVDTTEMLLRDQSDPALLERWNAPSMAARRQQLAADQWKWIEDTLHASNASWLFVAGHYPVFSGGEHGDTPVLKNKLAPNLHKYKVDAYLSGHDHTLQYLMDDKISYYVSGNACKTNGQYKPISQSKWGTLEHGFTAHSVDASTFTTEYYSSKGGKLHQVSQKRQRFI